MFPTPDHLSSLLSSPPHLQWGRCSSSIRPAVDPVVVVLLVVDDVVDDVVVGVGAVVVACKSHRRGEKVSDC